MCEHLGISVLTGKRVTGHNDSVIKVHLSLCNHAPDFEDFSILSTNTDYSQKIQVIQCNQVYFSSSNVSTHTTVIVKDYMLSEKFTFCFKITIKCNLTK